MEIKGKYGKAVVYNDHVEEEAISQITNLLNQPMAESAHVRIMPDVHAGAGCVIGYTAKLTDKIVPNLIGVDIGCGVTAYRLGNKKDIKLRFDKLDKYIREKVPSGREVNARSGMPNIFKAHSRLKLGGDPDNFLSKVEDVAKRTEQDESYVKRSIGTLGGGNHFIEIDEDDNHDVWVVVHTGSRNFGLKVAKFHQQVAEESVLGFDKEEYDKRVEEIKRNKKGKGIEVAINQLRKEMSKKGKATGLEYLDGDKAQQYFNDMDVAQKYARLNRFLIIEKIVDGFYKKKLDIHKVIESTHNYINFEDGIIRKGAISAHKGQRVIIPLNMADGVIVGYGKGNPEWNNSAPHGSGRKLSRSKAKSGIRLEDYQKIMKDKGVWSTSINKSTLDEAPQAYKNSNDIKSYLSDAVDIEVHMKPIYNFKASE
jgi:RNA-splicing ligase RtcB